MDIQFYRLFVAMNFLLTSFVCYSLYFSINVLNCSMYLSILFLSFTICRLGLFCPQILILSVLIRSYVVYAARLCPQMFGYFAHIQAISSVFNIPASKWNSSKFGSVLSTSIQWLWSKIPFKSMRLNERSPVKQVIESITYFPPIASLQSLISSSVFDKRN